MCKGTTNWEGVYIINKNIIPKQVLAKLNEGWISNHGGIPVDACIGLEVEELITKDIITVGSCCGHGEWNAHVLILKSEKEKIESLGYSAKSYNSLYDLVNLKTGTQIKE